MNTSVQQIYFLTSPFNFSQATKAEQELLQLQASPLNSETSGNYVEKKDLE